MADSLPNLVWGCRPDGACDFLSRQWIDYTGVPDSEQLGYRWLEQVHPDDRERVGDSWREAVKTGKNFDLELRIRSASGDYRWFKARSVPIRNADGAIVKWYGTHTDIDDLKRAATAQRRNLDPIGSVVENVREGVIVLERDLTVTFVNAAAERLLARKRGDVVGRKWKEAFPQLDGSLIEDGLGRAIKEMAPFALDARLPGSSAQCHVAVSPLPGAEGAAVVLYEAGK
jgi:PAS domain S-box-containing protein